MATIHASTSVPDAARPPLDEFLSDVVPVHEAIVARLTFPEGEARVPIARVNAGERPDITDLTRVLRSEAGRASIETQWAFLIDSARGARDLALLLVHFTSPVNCRFCLTFDIVQHIEFLTALQLRSKFVLMTEPICCQADGLNIPIGLPELEEVLRIRKPKTVRRGARV